MSKVRMLAALNGPHGNGGCGFLKEQDKSIFINQLAEITMVSIKDHKYFEWRIRTVISTIVVVRPCKSRL